MTKIFVSEIVEVDVEASRDVSDLYDEELMACVKEAEKRKLLRNQDEVIEEALSLLYRRDLIGLESLLIRQSQPPDYIKQMEEEYQRWLKSREAA